jgi:hypothetical protein
MIYTNVYMARLGWLNLDRSRQTGYISGGKIICMGDQAFEKERRIKNAG